MINPPIPDWDTNRAAYWIVRYCRGASVIAVFLVGPVLQVGFTRVLPFSLAVGLCILLLGHTLTRGRYLPKKTMKEVFTPSLWSTGKRLSILCYGLFVSWMAISFIWSPMQQYAVRDVSLLMIALPLIQFLAMEQATNSNREFVLPVMGGLVLVSLLVMLEFYGVTRLLELASDRNKLGDLNRVSIVLAVLCWAPLLFIKYKPLDWFLCTICIVLAGIAIFTAQGEAAKLSFICALIVGLLIKFFPSVSRAIAIVLAFSVLTLPFILPKIASPLQSESTEFLKQAHAHHRIATWLGFREVIVQKPIIGWGARADRYLGMEGLAPPVDPENRYSKKNTNPHNFIFEIWANFGLLGAAFIAGLIIALERLLNGLRRDQMIVGMQLLVGSFAYMCSGTSVMQGWWLATIAIILIAFNVACRQTAATENATPPNQALSCNPE